MKQHDKIKRILYPILPVISLITFFMVWLLASEKNPAFVPSPIAAWERFLLFTKNPINDLSLPMHMWKSLSRVLIAVGMASILGIAFGIFLGWNKTFFEIFSPLFEMLRPIPPIAWIPLVTLWFGIGEFPKVLIVFIASFVAIVINTFTGVKMVDPFIIDVGRAFGVNGVKSLSEVIIPSALPAIFAGIKTSVGAGWMSVLAAEMISGSSGLGFLITRGMDSADTPLIIVGMVSVGLVGALISIILTYTERWLCPWKDSQ